MTDAPNPEGFSNQLQDICEARCAEFGDPACWRLPTLVEPCEHITPCEECLTDCVKELEARVLSPAAVTVKPLEWWVDTDGNFLAKSPFGEYCAHYDESYGWLCMVDGHDDSWAKYPSKDDGFETENEAKAECERDYLVRMTPFVAPSPAPVAGWRDEILQHLDLSQNHEAGLIPVATKILLQKIADAAPGQPATEGPDAVQNNPVMGDHTFESVTCVHLSADIKCVHLTAEAAKNCPRCNQTLRNPSSQPDAAPVARCEPKEKYAVSHKMPQPDAVQKAARVRETLKLALVQDQGCGGTLEPLRVIENMKSLINDALRALSGQDTTGEGMSILDELQKESALRDRMSPSARLISDLLEAVGNAENDGVSLEKIERYLRDLADDLRDKAQDTTGEDAT